MVNVKEKLKAIKEAFKISNNVKGWASIILTSFGVILMSFIFSPYPIGMNILCLIIGIIFEIIAGYFWLFSMTDD